MKSFVAIFGHLFNWIVDYHIIVDFLFLFWHPWHCWSWRVLMILSPDKKWMQWFRMVYVCFFVVRRLPLLVQWLVIDWNFNLWRINDVVMTSKNCDGVKYVCSIILLNFFFKKIKFLTENFFFNFYLILALLYQAAIPLLFFVCYFMYFLHINLS